MGCVPVVIAVVVLFFESGSGTVCTSATYKTVTLDDYVYKHDCFPKGWQTFLDGEAVKEQIKLISPILFSDAKKYKIEPPMPNMFKAFEVSLDDIKAIIIGQDPTPQPGKATGLAFSLKPWPEEDARTVPSVLNMLIELKLEGRDVSLKNGDLTPWLADGVLLLNAALTVPQGMAGHYLKTWRPFTELLVEHINANAKPLTWILWGEKAKAFERFITSKQQYVRKGGHPSPIGGKENKFFGGNYFHCANEFLKSKGIREINWDVPGPPIMLECNLKPMEKPEKIQHV